MGRVKKNKNKSAYYAVIIIIIIILAFAVYQNRGTLRALNGSSEVFSYESGQNFSFDTQNGNVVAIGSDGAQCFSDKGIRKWNVIRRFVNPRMQNEGDFNLFYEKGNKEVYLYSDGSKIWEYVSDQPIITAKINAKGYAAVVSYETGYRAKIEIIDGLGSLLYKWQLSEDYVIDADVSPDCKQFAAATVSPNDANVTSRVTVVDIDGEKITGETLLEGTLTVCIEYQKNGSIAAVGSDKLVCISPRGEMQWAVDFEEKQLQKFKLGYNTSHILTFEGSRNNSILEIYGKDGKKTGEYISGEEIKDIDINGATIAVLEKQELSLISLKGAVMSETELKKDVKKVMLLPKNRIAAVGSSSVEIIKP
jgi:hypothetical protein